MSIYDRISSLQAATPWGSVLDAGSGRASLRWLLTQSTERWTAVTASPRMLEAMRREVGERQRPQDRLLAGNWMDPQLLTGEVYDTVLADYLLGAVEGFAPYWQDRLFTRLRPHVGGRLYLVGLEPYVCHFPTDPDGRLVTAIGRLRDACLLLGGDRPYREYPLDWVLRQLEAASFRVRDLQRIPIRYGERFINSQLDLCTAILARLPDRGLALALQQHVAELRALALAHAAREGGLRHGHDYLVIAEAA